MTAPYYDRVEGQNRLSERVRRETRAMALRLFRRGDRVLELGCGTGRDAVFLASHGMKVHATDISPRMIARTRERIIESGMGASVTTEVAPAAQAAWAGASFDGAYSNGAVLNLEPDLRRVVGGLAASVRPGGRVLLTAANRMSLFELLFYPLVLRPRKAFRKLRSTVPIPVSRRPPGNRQVVATQFLTPQQLIDRFAADFDLVSWRALQVFTPPWNLVDWAERLAGVLEPLERLEDRLGTWKGVRSLGAIYMLALVRRS